MRRLSPAARLAALLFLATGSITLAGLSTGHAPLDAAPVSVEAPIAQPPTLGGVLDPTLQAPPASDEDVLVERLVKLGANPDAAWSAILGVQAQPALANGKPDPARATNAVASLGLSDAVRAKAERLMRAYLAGRPVSLEGIDVPPDWIARIAALRDAGATAEEAAWLVRRADADQAVPGDAALHAAAALDELTMPEDVRVRVAGVLNVAPAASDLPVVGGDDERPIHVSPGLGSDAVMVPAAACPACPAYHYGNFIPTTNWLTHASTISAADCRVYRFSLTAGHSYRFTVCEGGGSSTFTTLIESSTYQNQICGTGPSGAACAGNKAFLDYTATYTGFFFVKVRNADAVAGSYRLAYRDTTPRCTSCPAYDFGSFTPSTTYQTHSSTLAAGECRIYRFQLQAGRTYRFTTCSVDSEGLSTGASATFDTVLEALNPSCAVIGIDDDACAPTSQLDVTPTTTGAYYLRVTDFNGAGGNYTVAYRDRTPCAICPAQDFGPFTPTTTYQTHSSSITSERCKVYRFNVTAGHGYRFMTCDLDAEGRPTGGFANFDTVIEVLNSGCSLVGFSDDDCSTVSFSSAVDVTPAYTGAMYVRVSGSSSGDYGSYTLAYRDLAGFCKTCPGYDVAPANAAPTYQTTPTASIEPNGGCKVYRFYLTVGNTYRFTTCNPDGSGIASGASATFDTVFDLRNSTCVLMGTNDNGPCGSSSELDFTAPNTGFYYLNVHGKTAADYGAFTLGYRQRLGVCKACPAFDYGSFTPTGNWQTHPSNVLPEACRVYRFQLTAGHDYEFSLCQGGGSTTFPAVLSGRDPSCAATGANFGKCASPTEDYVITAAGSGLYYVQLAGVTDTDTGNYRLAYRDLTLACEADCNLGTFNWGPFTPPTYPAVATHSDFIEYYCKKVYVFDVNAGDVLHVTTCAPGSAPFDSALLGQDQPGCATIGPENDNFCGDDATLDWLATYTGQAYVTVYDETGAPGGGGTYTLAYYVTPDETVANANCADGIDNDLDGNTDCQPTGDAGCACGPESTFNGNCADGVDNDNDGFMDAADPNCGTELVANANCADGVDNDGNGDVDCTGAGDAGCACGPESTFNGNCADGVDNDNDGFMDAADPNCGTEAVANANCADGVDNDGNGDVDCTSAGDAGCACGPESTFNGNCADGVDNDNDGFMDAADPNCGTEAVANANCADGVDNDGNGDVDCTGAGDAGCACGAESTFAGNCADGVDNDNDGFMDAADPNCGTEAVANANCADGVDNDGNGDVDCTGTGDPGCACGAESTFAGNCADGVDNDNDGSPDLVDSQCQTEAVFAGNCADSFDNDGNGDVDCLGTGDAGCACGPESTFDGNCFDGVDNDNDGSPDFLDSQCQIESVFSGNCADSFDNDGNGAIDCQGTGDVGCNCGPESTTAFNCFDGVDNDNDGDTDAADSQCQIESVANGNCADGFDNDGNFAIDCQGIGDLGCNCGTESTSIGNCSDGVDNDDDGSPDGLDSQCQTESVADGNCADGFDNDGDFATDCQGLGDAGCNCGTESTFAGNCSDGVDNDDDASPDGLDSQCQTESVANGNCADGFDNDGNFDTDCQGAGDAGCSCGPESSFDGNCSDGVDNDNDGFMDAADPNCGNESVADGNCADLIDNDGDGNTDAADPDC